MQTHTKGPWKVLEHARGNKRTCVTTANGAPVQAVICEIDVKSVAIDDATRLANARLIAAAPQLLANLKELVRYISDEFSASHALTHRANEAREAIAKAEGNA